MKWIELLPGDLLVRSGVVIVVILVLEKPCNYKFKILVTLKSSSSIKTMSCINCSTVNNFMIIRDGIIL